MPFLISVLAALTTGALALVLFSWAEGNPGKPGALRRTYDLLRGTSAVDRPAGKSQPGSKGTGLPQWNLWLRTAGVAFVLYEVGHFYFRSPLLAVLLASGSLLYPRYLAQARLKKRKLLMQLQLREALGALAASLRAGSSLAMAIRRSVIDLEQLLVDEKEKPLLEELQRTVEELDLGMSVEEALRSLKERVDLEDADDWVDAALLCQSRGGDLTRVMVQIAEIIGDKLTVQQQVRVLTAGKRMEMIGMTIVPPAMVALIILSEPEYMAPLYNTLVGKGLFLLGTVLLVLAVWIGRRIVDIQV